MKKTFTSRRDLGEKLRRVLHDQRPSVDWMHVCPGIGCRVPGCEHAEKPEPDEFRRGGR